MNEQIRVDQMSDVTIRDFQSDKIESDIPIRRFIQDNLSILKKRLWDFQSHDRSDDQIFKYSDIQEAADVRGRGTANQSNQIKSERLQIDSCK